MARFFVPQNQPKGERVIDVDLIVEQLRSRGHAVTKVNKVPENAGEYEFVVDGEMLSLSETRALLAADQTAE